MLLFYLAMIDSPEDQHKFTQLYELYRAPMLRLATKILGDEFLAEDAVHTAFVRVAEGMSKIGEVSCHQTRAFLVIIVRGIALNMVRAERKVIALPFDDFAETLEDGISLEDTVAGGISDALLREALEWLPPMHRDVLYLMYYEDLPVKDIAGVLGLMYCIERKYPLFHGYYNLKRLHRQMTGAY